MCEKKHEVKQGLQPGPENAGEQKILLDLGNGNPLDLLTIGITYRKRMNWKRELCSVAG
jgi:hypothetical protein